MVEVIEHGKNNVVDCKFCGAKLKYTSDDIKEKEYHITQRDSDFIKYIVCPECHSHVEFGKMYMRTV